MIYRKYMNTMIFGVTWICAKWNWLTIAKVVDIQQKRLEENVNIATLEDIANGCLKMSDQNTNENEGDEFVSSLDNKKFLLDLIKENTHLRKKNKKYSRKPDIPGYSISFNCATLLICLF